MSDKSVQPESRRFRMHEVPPVFVGEDIGATGLKVTLRFDQESFDRLRALVDDASARAARDPAFAKALANLIEAEGHILDPNLERHPASTAYDQVVALQPSKSFLCLMATGGAGDGE